MENGYIKLYRRLLASPVFANEGLLKLWVWCLAKAVHQKQFIPIRTGRGETVVALSPGQFLFGRKSAAKELHMKPSTVQDRMKKLENMQNIVTQPVTHYTVVTICNWEIYQADPVLPQHPTRQPTDNQPSTNRQPTVTYKNVKNNIYISNNVKDVKKKEKETTTARDEKPPRPAQMKISFSPETGRFDNINGRAEYWTEQFPAIDVGGEIRKAEAWLMANPKNRKSNYERFLVNWLTRAQDRAPGQGGGDNSRETVYYMADGTPVRTTGGGDRK